MNLLIRRAKSDDVPFIKKIWLNAFNENYSTNYLTFVFEKLLNIKNAFVIISNDVFSGIGFILPAFFKGKASYYLYSLAVDKKMRNHGLMSRFLEFSLSLAKEKGVEYVFLVPQSDSLRQYYKKRDFIDFCYMKKHSFKLNKSIYTSFSNVDLQSYSKVRKNYFQNRLLCFDDEFSQYSLQEGEFFSQNIVQCEYGYAVFSAEKDSLAVREVIAEKHNLELLLQSLLNKSGFKKGIAMLDNYIFSDLEGEEVPYAMINKSSLIDINKDFYANFLLD